MEIATRKEHFGDLGIDGEGYQRGLLGNRNMGVQGIHVYQDKVQ